MFKRKSKKIDLIFPFILVFALLALHFLPAAGVQAEELVVAQEDSPVSLSPHAANDGPSIQIFSQIHETLVDLNEDMEIEPGLAHSWEQIDDLTWEFEIYEGVYFHNGEELTADDVVFTLERLLDPDTGAPGSFIVDFLEKIEKVDEYTVRLTTAEPYAPILNHLAHPVTGILNRQAVEEAGDDYGTLEAVGTGPYEYVQWSTGDYIELERFEDYRGEVPDPEIVTIRPIVEDTVRAIELETGGVDIAYGIAPPDEERLREAPGTTLEPYHSLAILYVGLNAQEEPLDEVEVRQALNYAVNTGDIIEHIYGGHGAEAAGPLSENIWGYNPYLEGYEYDPGRAREILADAGHEDELTLSLFTTEDPQYLQTAELVQDNLRQVGVEVEVVTLDLGDMLERTAQGEHDMFVITWGTITGDADYGLYPTFHSDQFGAPGNRTFYASDRVDELLERARTVTDEEERLNLYHEAQEIISEEAPWIFISNPERLIGVGPGAENFVPHPMVAHDLSRVELVDQ